MDNIKWEDGAVCFADGEQWFVNAGAESEKYQLANLKGDRGYSFYGISGFSKHLQLNTIKQGDYIEASELGTEQKYNDAVEVFGLFGFKNNTSYSAHTRSSNLLIDDDGIAVCSNGWHEMSRRLTYQQLMAIGKLKRAMIERDEALIDADENTSILKGTLGAAKDYTRAGTIEGENTKETKAYNILKSMNIFYDEVEKVWYKKEYL